jgi:glycosyltransferase involved in cell wall biosynthesis
MNLSNPLKLFVDAHVFDQEYQGSRTFIKELYRQLVQKKDIHFYFGAVDLGNLKKIFPPAGNVSFVQYKSRSAFRRLLFDIPSIINRHQIDLAHFQYITPLRKNCRFIVTIHDVIFSEYPDEFSLFYRLRKKWLYRQGALKADILTTVSEYSKRSILKYLDNDLNVHVIPNGIDQRFFRGYDKALSKKFILENFGIDKFILYVSRFEQRKNHLALLQAFLELKLHEKGYHLVFLGHRSCKLRGFDTTLETLAPAVKNNIFISSDVTDIDILEFYRAAEIFVYPSKAEGFGIPPLEAGALKIPVICSGSSAMEDFYFFGRGHVSNPGAEQLAELLTDFLVKPPDEPTLTLIAETIKKKYDGKKSAEEFYQLLLQHKPAQRL